MAGAALTAATGCGEGSAEAADLRFPGSAPSLQVLARTSFQALERGDTTTLELLRLTEEEHNRVVWPELPASAPDVNYPVDLAWQNIQLRNQRSLARQLPAFRGRDTDVKQVECRGAVETFATFRVHTDCWVVFGVEGDDRTLEIQLFKDVLERGGGFKIFRYYDEAPGLYRGPPLP